MKELTEEQRFQIGLRWASGLSLKQTAGELHLSMSTVSKYYAVLKASPQATVAAERHRFSNRREVREQVKDRIDNNIDMATGKCVIGCCEGEEPPDNLNSESSIKERTS